MMARRPFASRFPKVAALLAATGLSTTGAAPAAVEEDDDDGAEAGAPKGVDAGALQAAFERDADAQVSDERKRWAAVLESDEGQANVTGAVALLSDTDMDADKIGATLKKMGPAAKAPAKRGEGDGGEPGAEGEDEERGERRGEGGRERRIGDARERLRGERGVDKRTGGGAERSGAADLDKLREDRAAARKRRNEAAASRSGRSAGRGARPSRGRDDQ